MFRRIYRGSVFRVKNFFPKSRGQVSETHEVGRWIKLLASLDEVSVIVEIGTWNGLGTSRLLGEGVKSRARPDSARVIGLEANQKLFLTANTNLKKFEFFSVIWGTIVTESQLDNKDLSDAEKGWILQDIEDLKSTPYVLDAIPEHIDLLILDGGEFSTWAEFQTLQHRVSKWIILDDTHTRKCKRILDEVRGSDNYSIIWTSDERNGTAVLLKN